MSEGQIVQATPLPRTRASLAYDLDGWILMLGTGYDTNTSLHLAEYRAPGAVETMLGSPIIENGQRVWKDYPDIEIDSNIFPEIGIEFEQKVQVKIAQVGSATSRLIRQRSAVDFAVEWFIRKNG
jgi:aminoglycoside 3-N-acetyltransferase